MVAFGMQLPIQSQSTIFVQPWEPAAGAPELVQVTQACEAAGFDYVAVCDHIAVPAAQAEAMSTAWWDTIATLSYLAAVTERVRLLSHVYVLPYRHPLVVAKAWATLDALSGGRAILGVGAGHVEGEFDVLGVPFADRGRLLDEAHRRRPRRARRRVRDAPGRALAVRRARPATASGPALRCRSGWAARPSRPCAEPPSGATGGCRRDRPREAWRPASTSSGPTGPPPAATTRSCWAPCRGPSTSATPRGTRPAACAARPTRSPATCAPTPTSASTRSRWAS